MGIIRRLKERNHGEYIRALEMKGFLSILAGLMVLSEGVRAAIIFPPREIARSENGRFMVEVSARIDRSPDYFG